MLPLSAFLSLFHQVIDDPLHHDTKDNLAFLDVAAGYFRRLEYVMKQEFPFAIFPKLAALAQEYVLKLPREHENRDSTAGTGAPENTSTPVLEQGTQTIPSVDVIGDRTVPNREQSIHIPSLDKINDSNALLTLADGDVAQADGVQYPVENEVIDFFGDFLDETYSSLYGGDLVW